MNTDALPSNRFAGYSHQSNSFEFMLAEQPVAMIDLTTHSCSILNRELLPFSLYRVADPDMFSSISQWIRQRTLPVSRKNCSQILKACGLSSTDDLIPLLLNFHALSLVDNYWFRQAGSDLSYASVNLYENPFNELVTVALQGELDVSLRNNSPDLNQRGTLAKCYKREGDTIFIYKTSSSESSMLAEVFASRLAAHCEFDTVKYVQVHHKSMLCSKCAIETSSSVGWVPARDITIAGIDPKEVALNLTPTRYHQMLVFDYLAGNIDRHNENWSFEMDNQGKLLGLSKLYDFDNCFLADDSTTSLITLHPLLQDALVSARELKLDAEWFTKVQGFLNSQQNSFSEYSKVRLNILKSHILGAV